MALLLNSEKRLYAKLVGEHRELLVMQWICEQFAARYDHLEALIETSNGTVRRVVRALRELGCVETRKVMVGEHMWVLPTRKGYSHCGLTYRPVPLSTMSLAHIAAINDVRIYIQQRSEDTRWVSERQLAAEAHRHSRRPDARSKQVVTIRLSNIPSQ